MNVGWKRAERGQVSVTVCSSDLALIKPWADLAARLDANVFMHPTALIAGAESGVARIHVLLAWDEATDPPRPSGFWALRERRTLPLTPAFLETLPYDYAFTSNAVVDGACADEIMAAFFDAIRKDPRLPKVISLRSFEADPRCFASWSAAAGTGSFSRAIGPLRTGPPASKSRNRAAKRCAIAGTRSLRRETSRSSTSGRGRGGGGLRSVSGARSRELEGQAGYGAAMRRRRCALARRLFRDLASQGQASVALLRIDGEAIAALVLLFSGRQAYTWKTAFNAAFARFSPRNPADHQDHRRPARIRRHCNHRLLLLRERLHDRIVDRTQNHGGCLDRRPPAQLAGLCGGSDAASGLRAYPAHAATDADGDQGLRPDREKRAFGLPIRRLTSGRRTPAISERRPPCLAAPP